MRQMRMGRILVEVAVGASALVWHQPAAAQTPQVSPAPPVSRRIVVSIPDRQLAVVVNGEVVRVFPVAVGAPASPSPVGRFTIVNRLTNPTYYRPGKVIGPGPANPLGTRWMGLDRQGYGIHGTDEPLSIGHARSHGCIRLRNADVERLFDLVRVGDQVELIAERTSETARLFDRAIADPPPTAVALATSSPTTMTDSSSRKE